ncbi:hypothetical protein [Shewanella cyperi]|uniref:hypothetical protein n=1 Tax=Shewanella cyperi TaxID=2814292 RepID=UPI001A93F2F5|nr:hypothetical protein [Shewanella cyperi]QSX40151.1 hypothetical protein JYB84_14400 [Shewanella cyperi]
MSVAVKHSWVEEKFMLKNVLILGAIALLPVCSVQAESYEALNQKCLALQKDMIAGDLEAVLAYYHPAMKENEKAFNLFKKYLGKSMKNRANYRAKKFSSVEILSSQEEAITESDRGLPFEIVKKVLVKPKIEIEDGPTFKPACYFVQEKDSGNWYMASL